jgi:hypothetical protein
MAAMLLNSRHRQTALPMFRRAAEMAPTDPIRCNLAIALTNFGEYAAASKILSQLLEEDKHNLAAWHAYGVLNLVAGLPDDAVECFQSCMVLDKTNGMYVFDHAYALMQAGRWVEGLAAYERRRDFNPERTFPGLSRWDGAPDKVVYAWAEQGIGDTFQFARFLPFVVAKSKRTLLALPPSLWSLFKGYQAQGVEVVRLGTIIDDVEADVPLMSLPHILKMQTPEQWPEDPGYLASDIEPLALPQDLGRLKVGMCWSCSPTSHHFRERSIPFAEMLQIAAHSDVDLYSLQVGEAAADIGINAAQFLVEDLVVNTTDDWGGTAAALKAMDVVVTTDTSVAHLSGILKKPTIMLLARRDWWRWGNAGETTPWYPTMTIVRQETPFSWAKELAKVSTLIGDAARERCAKTKAA